jgi:hypothetical protein
MNKYVADDRMLFIIIAPASVAKEQLDKLGTVEVLPMPLRRDQPATRPAAALQPASSGAGHG